MTGDDGSETPETRRSGNGRVRVKRGAYVYMQHWSKWKDLCVAMKEKEE
jgi:hypothetical protein